VPLLLPWEWQHAAAWPQAHLLAVRLPLRLCLLLLACCWLDLLWAAAKSC